MCLCKTTVDDDDFIAENVLNICFLDDISVAKRQPESNISSNNKLVVSIRTTEREKKLHNKAQHFIADYNKRNSPPKRDYLTAAGIYLCNIKAKQEIVVYKFEAKSKYLLLI